MAKRDMKKALGASLKAEERAVKNRFEKAEAVLGKNRSTTRIDSQQQQSKNGGRIIRDSFTIPDSEYQLISQIKKRCMKGGTGVTKSEILRAGLAALDKMSDKELLDVVGRLAKVKTGRPPRTAEE